MCGMVGTFTIVVLGSPGVGKTAIIRQFLYNDFSQVYTPTTSKYVHRPSVILDDTMYDLKIVDVPHIPAFPTTGAQEWSDSRCRGIRNANAYVLVYDICCFDSFEYVKTIRQQIAEARMVPLSITAGHSKGFQLLAPSTLPGLILPMREYTQKLPKVILQFLPNQNCTLTSLCPSDWYFYVQKH
ncbi:ras-like protein family member 10A isoform X3 [Hemitrygon akajei]|uniref:ras-like protein family member 10A isoform X3 n=1 Tax=Hemitrygon akajei TaxID=2704970 RepID=UPI003BFA0A7A